MDVLKAAFAVVRDVEAGLALYQEQRATGTKSQSGIGDLFLHTKINPLTSDGKKFAYPINPRRVARAREALLGRTRSLLGERLRLRDDELDSVMRIIDSQLRVSVHRLLGTGSDP